MEKTPRMTETRPERIILLDVVRGAAVLGILLMNIRLFSEPAAAYFNPMVYGDHTGVNKLWWYFQFIFADQKFMAIFSMLFGASTAIICDGLTRRGEAVLAVYSKRILGLLIIGLIHAYLFWSGDILVSYALASFVPFLFRNIRWQVTAMAGLALLAFGTLSSIAAYHSISDLPLAVQATIAEQYWHPEQSALAAEVAAYQSTWLEHFTLRAHHAWEFQTDVFVSWGFWRVGGLMLLGLALYRQGFIAGRLTAKTYGILTIIFLPLGFWLVVTGLTANADANWQFPFSFFMANTWNYWGSLLVALGYISFFAWLLKATQVRFGFSSLANIGRAALSNYLFQTLACITIFYGFGGGLFGKLERSETAFVVVAVWAAQLALSAIWFRHYTKGPVESVWHRFTYSAWFGKR